MIRHGLRALLLGWFCCWLIQGQAQCGLHKLENVCQYITEEINFNEIIRQLLNLIAVAKRNHFTTLGENIITTANKIGLSGGIALELATAKQLQQRGIEGNFLLQLQWLAGELLVYAIGSANALFFGRKEVGVILENYNIESIEFAQKGRLLLRDNKILLWREGDELICKAGKLILKIEGDFQTLIDEIQADMRKLFDINILLHNIISKQLHSCCVAKSGWNGQGCVSKNGMRIH